MAITRPSLMPSPTASVGSPSYVPAPSSTFRVFNYPPQFTKPRSTNTSTVLSLLFLTLLYSFSLSISYVYIIVPFFAYEGYSLNFNFTSYLLALSFIFFFAVVLASRRSTNPVYLLLWAIFLVAYVPFSLFFSLQNKDSVLFFHVSIAFALAVAIAMLPPIFIPTIHVDKRLLRYGLWFIMTFISNLNAYLSHKAGISVLA
ncbi:MAG: hypothetical protein KatS3mg082_2501 [Nitrospiraceae bacterium]|nr:MAG: hypothetical protein KatS3mg082_2501 [Nitrospiraceae bacterium]